MTEVSPHVGCQGVRPGEQQPVGGHQGVVPRVHPDAGVEAGPGNTTLIVMFIVHSFETIIQVFNQINKIEI